MTQNREIAPFEEDGFVGRGQELASLEGLLGRARLVTILGAAGIGKTRIALRYGALVQATGKQVWFCDLTQCRDEEGFLGCVADVLGVSRPPGVSMSVFSEQLGEHLSGRGAGILVCDNVEQIAATVGDALGGWLRRAQDLRVLVTSRQRLDLRVEQLFELGPLGMPTEEDDGVCEAARLFVERAGVVRSGYEPGDADLASIEAIVRLLDGIPLAIELAAARMRLMSPAQLLERLSERFKVLRTPTTRARPRFQTMWGALEWSWMLLDPAEQSCLMQCAIFPDGFSTEAAEAVVHEDEVLDLLQALRDKSLVRALTQMPEQGPEALRLGLFQSVRDFGLKKLDASDEEDALWARYLDWALSLAKDSEKVVLERHNLRAAIEVCVSGGKREEALRILMALEPAIAKRGPYGQHAALFDEALALEGDCSPVLLARALEARGDLYRAQGQLEEGAAVLDEALVMACDLKDPSLEGNVALKLGLICQERGDAEASRAYLVRARGLFEGLGDRQRQAQAIGRLADAHFRGGRLGEAEACYLEALDMLRAAGDKAQEGVFLNNLSVLLRASGRLDEARESTSRALIIARAIGHRRLEGIALGNMCSLRLERGHFDGAWASVQSALEVFRGLGDVRMEALNLGYVGIHKHFQGALAESVATHRRALRLLSLCGDRYHVALLSGYLGAALAGQGLTEAAEEALEVMSPLCEGNPAVASAQRLHRGHLEIALGRPDAAKAVCRRLESLPEPEVLRHNDVRLALVLLKHVLEALQNDPDEKVLTISADGRAFKLGGGEAVSLGRRRAARRLLLELAIRRRDEPGVGVSVYTLMEVGWPGEELHPDAGSNRVYVALNELRKMGLRDALLNQSGGYLFDPDLNVVLAPLESF